MADLNSTYHPYLEPIDEDAIKIEVAYEWLPVNVRANVDKYLADLRTTVAQQTALVTSIKTPYTGKTDVERQAWLWERIDAIYSRADQIRALVEKHKELITDLGGTPAPDVLKTIGTVLTVIPVTTPVGALTTVISTLVNRSNDNAAYKQQKISISANALSGYSQDVTQLSTIRSQLVTELASAPTTSDDPVNNAATVIANYWPYLVGATLLLLVIVWYRRRNRKRSKR
jgi:hypothetical protein